jgi:pimeloyl-ACP methyl ester carboxylesterase
MDAPYREHVFRSEDDIPLYCRDYGRAGTGSTPVLCLAGLTRNSKEFHPIASHLSATRRVLALDLRGRGRSGYDPNWHNYNPMIYVRDVVSLLATLGIPRVVILGTSLGGICAMGLGAAAPTHLAGVILNDVGPTLDPNGISRIAGYVGRDVRMPDLATAAAALKQQFSAAYPARDDAFWLNLADAIFVADPADGNFRLDYDLRIGEALREQAKSGAAIDLWPLYRGFAKLPVLAVRGALSDVLDAETFDRMAVEKPDLVRLLIPNVGHTPIPQEEPFLSALDRFVASL